MAASDLPPDGAGAIYIRVVAGLPCFGHGRINFPAKSLKHMTARIEKLSPE
jgi:hypothetical protein